MLYHWVLSSSHHRRWFQPPAHINPNLHILPCNCNTVAINSTVFNLPLPSCAFAPTDCTRPQVTTVNDRAVIKAKTARQNIERLKLSAPVYTDTSTSGLVTPHAEEIAHVAFTSHDRHCAWKVQDDEAWVMRKKYTPKKPGVLRLCRTRKVNLVRVGAVSHVTCSCMTWEMKRHGCRHTSNGVPRQKTLFFLETM
jgi:hypothetical protein